jgi:acyl dehydratase
MAFEVPDFVVSAERIGAYAAATGDPLPAYRGEQAVAPPVFAIVPVWPAIQSALAEEALGLDVSRIVHGEQHMRFHRPIRAGDVLRSGGELAALEERGQNEVFVLRFSTETAEGTPVAEQDVVCVSRGTAEGNRAAVTASGNARRLLDPPDQEPDAVRTVHLAEDITYRYAEASGDDNRIHVDPVFARDAGLPGIIVQGLCLLSIALQGVIEVVGDRRPERVRALGVRFSRPLQPGRSFETRIWSTQEGASFEGAGPDGKPVLRNGTVTLAPADIDGG